MSYLNKQKFFFIGIAGAGMSAIAQFLSFKGKDVMGSDRLFVQEPQHPVIKQLKKAGIELFPQGKAKIPDDALVVVSTAIEKTVPELVQAREKGLTIIHRTDLLKDITDQYKTIAVAGTAGKSTTTAMIFHILQQAGFDPSLITGAPLISLQSKGIVGNAWHGQGSWLVIEADESDGTLVKYSPEIGLILNIDLDHKELDELMKIFSLFARNSKTLIVNRSNPNAASLTRDGQYDFCTVGQCPFNMTDIAMTWAGVDFKVKGQKVAISLLGEHNAMNATAAIAACVAAGVDVGEAAKYIANFRGIARRMQVIYRGINFSIIDDYAHNPSKVSAAIATGQRLAGQVIAWFQPHGFSPLKLWGDELVGAVAALLRDEDIFVLSPVYYAGGTAPKDVCARDYIDRLRQKGTNAYFLEQRKALPEFIRDRAQPPTVVLLMGARDPMLGYFANYVSNQVIYFDNQF